MEQNGNFEGFAQLKNIKSTEYTKNSEEYIEIDAIIHGSEEGKVIFQRDSKLQEYALRLTGKDDISELIGTYLPVDKTEEKIYKPSESLYSIIKQSDATRINISTFEIMYFTEEIKEGIRYGYIVYNSEEGIWELKHKYKFMIFTSSFANSVQRMVIFSTAILPLSVAAISTLIYTKLYLYLAIALTYIAAILLDITVQRILRFWLRQSDQKIRDIPS